MKAQAFPLFIDPSLADGLVSVRADMEFVIQEIEDIERKLSRLRKRGFDHMDLETDEDRLSTSIKSIIAQVSSLISEDEDEVDPCR